MIINLWTHNVNTGFKINQLWLTVWIFASLVFVSAQLLNWNVPALHTHGSISPFASNRISKLTEDHTTLIPLVPFITIPSSLVPFWIMSMILSAAFHELGHFIAALAFGVPVLNFGLVLHFWILPGAFVTLSNLHLSNFSDWKRLVIVFMGPYHNLILALFAYCALHHLDVILAIAYKNNSGLVVLNIKSQKLAEHLFRKDIIKFINFNPANSIAEFKTILNNPVTSFCIGASAITLDNKSPCCNTQLVNSDDKVCLWDAKSINILLSLPPSAGLTHQIVPRYCTSFNESHLSSPLKSAKKLSQQCDESEIEMMPLVAADQSLYYFDLESVWRSPKLRGVLYISDSRIMDELEIGEFIPRFYFIPVWGARVIEDILRYVFCLLL